MLISDDFLLFLVHSAIDKFKKRYPGEEPFIKIQCLRTKGRADKDFNWRETKYTSFKHNKTEIEYDERESIFTEKRVQKIKQTTNKRVKRRANESDDVVQRRALLTSGVTHENIIEERTKLVEVKTSEEMHVAIEIIDDELDNNIHAIKIDTKFEQIQKDAILSMEPHQDKIIMYNENKKIIDDDNYIMNVLSNSQTLEKVNQELQISLNDTKENVTKAERKLKQVHDLEEKNIALTKLVESQKESTNSELLNKIKKNFSREISVSEVIEKYIEIQMKLNKLKQNLEIYIKPLSKRFKDEYYKYVQDNGTLLSTIYLIKHYHDICESDEDELSDFD
jgi:hypothetical protein